MTRLNVLSETVAALYRQATPLPEPLRYGNVLARSIVLVSLNKMTVFTMSTRWYIVWLVWYTVAIACRSLVVLGAVISWKYTNQYRL